VLSKVDLWGEKGALLALTSFEKRPRSRPNIETNLYPFHGSLASIELNPLEMAEAEYLGVAGTLWDC
jgi:hypothetical protein